MQTLPFGPHPHLFRSWLSQTLPSSSHKHKMISANTQHTDHRRKGQPPQNDVKRNYAPHHHILLFSAASICHWRCSPGCPNTLGIVLTQKGRQRSPPAHLTFTSFGVLNLRDIPSCESMRPAQTTKLRLRRLRNEHHRPAEHFAHLSACLDRFLRVAWASAGWLAG